MAYRQINTVLEAWRFYENILKHYEDKWAQDGPYRSKRAEDAYQLLKQHLDPK